MKTAIIVCASLLLIACTGPAVVQKPDPSSVVPRDYCLSSACKGCHDRIFDQHALSHHDRSFANPVFQRQYFDEILPLTTGDASLSQVAIECTACHAPIAYATRKGLIGPQDLTDPRICGGITCDFCHSITHYTGKTPGNGNYVSSPCDNKLGPFQCETNWHHVYSELHTKSEFCGICHNQVNHLGLEIKSTYAEWFESPHAKKGIQCQDCHMNLKGYLAGGEATYEKGTAAFMTVGEAPYREKLYTHRFPGAHSGTQIAASGALGLLIEAEGLSDREISVRVYVNNEKTGHKMPSGSTDLRLLWLEVDLHAESKTIPLPAAAQKGAGSYDVAGRSSFDQEFLGGDIPAGSRVYRSVFADAEGRQTLSSYKAVKIIFDNRLNALEVREEAYRIKISPDIRGTIVLEAHLKYLPYPSSFLAKFGLRNTAPYELASAQKVITLK